MDYLKNDLKKFDVIVEKLNKGIEEFVTDSRKSHLFVAFGEALAAVEGLELLSEEEAVALIQIFSRFQQGYEYHCSSDELEPTLEEMKMHCNFATKIGYKIAETLRLDDSLVDALYASDLLFLPAEFLLVKAELMKANLANLFPRLCDDRSCFPWFKDILNPFLAAFLERLGNRVLDYRYNRRFSDLEGDDTESMMF